MIERTSLNHDQVRMSAVDAGPNARKYRSTKLLDARAAVGRLRAEPARERRDGRLQRLAPDAARRHLHERHELATE